MFGFFRKFLDLHCEKDSGSWLSQLSSLLIIMTQKYDVMASILKKQGKGVCYGLKNLKFACTFFLVLKSVFCLHAVCIAISCTPKLLACPV